MKMKAKASAVGPLCMYGLTASFTSAVSANSTAAAVSPRNSSADARTNIAAARIMRP